MTYLLAYILLAVPLLAIWYFLRNLVNVMLPLLVPIIYLVIRAFLNKKEERKWDEEFVNFMSVFASLE